MLDVLDGLARKLFPPVEEPPDLELMLAESARQRERAEAIVERLDQDGVRQKQRRRRERMDPAEAIRAARQRRGEAR